MQAERCIAVPHENPKGRISSRRQKLPLGMHVAFAYLFNMHGGYATATLYCHAVSVTVLFSSRRVDLPRCCFMDIIGPGKASGRICDRRLVHQKDG